MYVSKTIQQPNALVSPRLLLIMNKKEDVYLKKTAGSIFPIFFLARSSMHFLMQMHHISESGVMRRVGLSQAGEGQGIQACSSQQSGVWRLIFCLMTTFVLFGSCHAFLSCKTFFFFASFFLINADDLQKPSRNSACWILTVILAVTN